MPVRLNDVPVARCGRCGARDRLGRQALRRAQSLAASGFALAALCAMAMLLLLVRPITLEARTLGVNQTDISPRLASAGMPTVEQIGAIAGAGYQVVINLAPSNAHGSTPNERELVTDKGMVYEHVPVDFARPTPAHFDQFVAVMRKHADQRIFVHCQVNMRASVFVYLYRVMELNEDPERAFETVLRVWQPSAQWRALIRDLHARSGKPLPFAFEKA